MESRLDTFTAWSHSAPTPQTLAAAGFFFTGVEDHVRCFACDGGLRQWDAGDNPWVEHCRWFPAYHFARTSKGDQYIERIQASVDQGEDLSELEETRPSGNISPTLKDLNIRKRNEIRPIQQEAEAVDTHVYNDGILLPNPSHWRAGIRLGEDANAHEQNNISTYESARADDKSRSNRKRPRYPGKTTVENRLDTFNAWPHLAPTPQTLAVAGFFFTGDADLVRCHQCGIGLKDFSLVDDPMSEHIKHADSCDFLIDLYGVTGLEQKRCLINEPEAIRRRQLESFKTQKAPDTKYRRPEYAGYDARLATFNGWPEEVSQKPCQLAHAGFYFTGVEDHVRCFACDGGLRQWDAGDDPWVEHCRWFPACSFARKTKGDQYIELIQASVDQGEDFSELEETRPVLQHQETSPEDFVTSGIDNITLGRAELEEHRRTCIEDLGFPAEEFEEALIELRKSGNILPTLEDLIICIGDIQKRNEIRQVQLEAVTVDTPESILEENARLKHILKCQMCNDNNVNALFLPCAHHRMCMDCASKYDVTDTAAKRTY
ncbi:XIAP-like protein [Mya arenaria]|uniref:XIAP-like protein n=1 Tax=Mya arenaria TaxID=6604 RepID=A0ABY7EHU8_MYAAR|nr:XIAP-like protein [Mya arenaria]